MWRLNTVHHKAGRKGTSVEELKLKRRDHEKVLRQARKDSQLVSKRLLLNDDEEEEGANMDTECPEQVVELFWKVQHGGEEREVNLRALRKALRKPAAQLRFVKLENSIQALVGLLSGLNSQCRLEAVRCLHELSHSPHPNVGHACLPATPYLLTYLSGQSAKFTELCLYTLGNLCPDSEAVREKVLAQGIIPALASCIQIKSPLSVVEAAAFTLSQLLQARDAPDKIVLSVLVSGLVPQLLAMLSPDPEFGPGPAIECAWCLHYLTCSGVDNRILLSHGTLLRCSSLLVTLGGAVAEGSKEEGIELLIWPLVRCIGNLVSSTPLGELEPQLRDARILAALCAFAQVFLQKQPALSRESAWVINNLTADSGVFCSALLFLNLIPGLIQLLPFSQGINTMVLRILGNVAHKGRAFCLQLVQAGLLPALCATLKMADQEMVTLSLEVLLMLLVSSPEVAEEFSRQSGLPLLEAIQYNSEGEMRQRAAYLLENHLTSH